MQVRCNNIKKVITAKDLENKVSIDDIQKFDENGNGLEQAFKLLRYRLAFTDSEFQQAISKAGFSLTDAYNLMMVAVVFGEKHHEEGKYGKAEK